MNPTAMTDFLPSKSEPSLGINVWNIIPKDVPMELNKSLSLACSNYNSTSTYITKVKNLKIFSMENQILKQKYTWQQGESVSVSSPLCHSMKNSPFWYKLKVNHFSWFLLPVSTNIKWCKSGDFVQSQLAEAITFLSCQILV